MPGASTSALATGRNSHHLHRCQISTFPPLRREKARFQHAAVIPPRCVSSTHPQPQAGWTFQAPELCPFSGGMDKARAEQQVKGGTVCLHQGCGEGVGGERDKRNGRAQPQASNPPLPGDSAKMPIDGISSITEREGSHGLAPEAAPSNGRGQTAPSPPTPSPGRFGFPRYLVRTPFTSCLEPNPLHSGQVLGKDGK